MGLFDFLGNVGRKFRRQGGEAEEIMEEIQKELRDNVSGLGVVFNNGVVTLQGQAKSQAAKEKAVLIAGNHDGVRQVNDDRLTVAGQPQQAAPPAGQPAVGKATAAQPRFYTIKSGDTLSKIAKEVYGDANDWQQLFEANREVIQDPDKIYPGQQIRIPADLKS